MLRGKISSLDVQHRFIGFITVTMAGGDTALSPSDLHSAASVTVTRSEIKDFSSHLLISSSQDQKSCTYGCQEKGPMSQKATRVISEMLS